jgi:GAF domain-containing protein
MNSNQVSLSNVVSTALAQTKLTGFSDVLKTIAATMDAYGIILWQAIPQSDLDKNSLGGYLSVLADWFQNNERFALHNLPVRRSATGKAIMLGKSININDVLQDPTVYKDGPFLLRARIKAMCTVPLTFRDGTLGALNLYRNSPRAFSDADLSLLEQLAL